MATIRETRKTGINLAVFLDLSTGKCFRSKNSTHLDVPKPVKKHLKTRHQFGCSSVSVGVKAQAIERMKKLTPQGNSESVRTR